VDDDAAVVEPSLVGQWRAHHDDGQQITRRVPHTVDRRARGVQHHVGQHQVVDRVAGQAELGEDGERDAVVGALPGDRDHTVGVRGRIRDGDGDGAGGDAREALVVGGVEFHAVSFAGCARRVPWRRACRHRTSAAAVDRATLSAMCMRTPHLDGRDDGSRACGAPGTVG